MREYDSAFFWLEDAKLVNVCRNSTDPNVGLGLHEDGTSLKCYQADTGLLVSQAFADSVEMLGEVYREMMLDNLSINEGNAGRECGRAAAQGTTADPCTSTRATTGATLAAPWKSTSSSSGATTTPP